MGIADWPAQDRPRERLLAQGAARLTDAELVAVCLRSGIRGKSAVDLARELITQFRGLGGLLGAGVPDLQRVKGLGAAKAAQLAAVLELARRALREELRTGSALTTPAAVRDYLRLTLGSRAHEVFVCVHLDAQHRVIGAEELFRGTLTQTSVYPREVVKAALAANAAAVIFAQYHHYRGKRAPRACAIPAFLPAFVLHQPPVTGHLGIGAVPISRRDTLRLPRSTKETTDVVQRSTRGGSSPQAR